MSNKVQDKLTKYINKFVKEHKSKYGGGEKVTHGRKKNKYKDTWGNEYSAPKTPSSSYYALKEVQKNLQLGKWKKVA